MLRTLHSRPQARDVNVAVRVHAQGLAHGQRTAMVVQAVQCLLARRLQALEGRDQLVQVRLVQLVCLDGVECRCNVMSAKYTRVASRPLCQTPAQLRAAATPMRTEAASTAVCFHCMRGAYAGQNKPYDAGQKSRHHRKAQSRPCREANAGGNMGDP